MIKNPEIGMTVFSVFGILNKEHMYIGKIVDIHPEWESGIIVQWQHPISAKIPASEDELFTSMLDAKHAHSDKLNMELDKEILAIYNKYPEAMDTDKGVEG